jgi:hypothetical protein
MGKLITTKSTFVLFTYDLPAPDQWYSTYEIGIRLDYKNIAQVKEKINLINQVSKTNWNIAEIDQKANAIMTKIDLIKNDLESWLPEIPLSFYTLQGEDDSEIIKVRTDKGVKLYPRKKTALLKETESIDYSGGKYEVHKKGTIKYFDDLGSYDNQTRVQNRGKDIWENFIDDVIKEPLLWNVVVNNEIVFDIDEIKWVIDELQEIIRNSAPTKRKVENKDIKTLEQLSWLISFESLFEKDVVHNPKYEMTDIDEETEFIPVASAFRNARGNFASKLKKAFKQFSQRSVYLLPTELALAPNKAIKDQNGEIIEWTYDKNNPEVNFKYTFDEKGISVMDRHKFTWDEQRVVTIFENGIPREIKKIVEQRDPRIETMKRAGKPTIEEIIYSELYPLYYLSLQEVLISKKNGKFKARFNRFDNKFAYNLTEKGKKIEPDFDRWVKWIRISPPDEESTLKYTQFLSSMVEESIKESNAFEELLKQLQEDIEAIEGVKENGAIIKPATITGQRAIKARTTSKLVNYDKIIDFYPKAQKLEYNDSEILNMIEKMLKNKNIMHPDQLTKYRIDLPDNARNIDNFKEICKLMGWYFTFPNEWAVNTINTNLLNEIKEKDDIKEARLEIEKILFKMREYAMGNLTPT